MKSNLPSRLPLGAAIILLFAFAPGFAHARQPKFAQPQVVKPQNRPPVPPPAARPAAKPPQNSAAPRPAQNGAASLPREEHLEKWMENHKNLSLADQQRALQNEPGFRELPPQLQQRRLNMLGQLYNMNPRERSRMLDRTEALERLTPQQRQQWKGAVQQLGSVPQPRKSLIAHAIVDLREMPPAQRQQVIDSPAFGAQFSDNERSMIRTLLTAEPYPGNRAP